MRAKHRKDYNHGKGGWIGPNPRYSGQRRTGRAANAGNDSRYYRVRNPKFEDIYYPEMRARACPSGGCAGRTCRRGKAQNDVAM